MCVFIYLFTVADLKILLCSDVHFTLIGFGESTLYHPAVYTTGGKISFEGKSSTTSYKA